MLSKCSKRITIGFCTGLGFPMQRLNVQGVPALHELWMGRVSVLH